MKTRWYFYELQTEISADTLLEVHHPGERLREVVRGELMVLATPSTLKCCKVNWNTAKAVVTYERFKAPGMDDIYPVMGYVPTSWQKVKVLFIAKPGKDDHSNPKNFGQISLTSFLLKDLKRVVERHIRGKALKSHINGLVYEPPVDVPRFGGC